MSFLYSLATSSVTWTAVGLFSAALGLLYANQDKMLYVARIPGFPHTCSENPFGYRSPADHGVPYDNVMITTADGLKLHAWFLRSTAGAKQAPTLVFFHANAGNMGLRTPNVVSLFNKLNCNILIFDYRGYGISEGLPNEEGLMLDADAVMEWVMKHDAVDPARVVLFGRSLGGAVAMYVAAKHGDKIAGIIVENTFFNISRMVDKLFSWLGVFKALVLRIYWPSDERIRTVTAPILLVSGTHDEIVPHDHSKALYDIATAAKSRELYVVEGGKHNDCWQVGGQGYLQKFADFVAAVCEGRGGAGSSRAASKFRNKI